MSRKSKGVRIATSVTVAAFLFVVCALQVQASPVNRATVVDRLSREQSGILIPYSPAAKTITSSRYSLTGSVRRNVSRGEKKNNPDVRTMTVTAYTKWDKGMNGKGITASGAPVQEGVTIAAPPDIPFGTRIYIPALNHEYVVTDRGGAIKGDRLDLYMESRERAIEFGKKRLEVVIERGRERGD